MQPESKYAEQLKKQGVDGRALVELTVEKLIQWDIPDVPAERLVKRVPWCKQIDGVVLVPTINSLTNKNHFQELVTSTSLNSDSITVVCGENARGCLGGLDQLFCYMNQ